MESNSDMEYKVSSACNWRRVPHMEENQRVEVKVYDRRALYSVR